MKCGEARRSLVSYLDQDLDPVKGPDLKAHLAGCEACRRELGTLKASLDLLREESPPELTEAFSTSLVPLLRTKLAERRRVLSQLLPRFAWVSGALLTALIAVVFVLVRMKPEQEQALGLGSKAGWGDSLQELVPTMDVEALELSLLEDEPETALLSLAQSSQGLEELLRKGISVTSLQKMEESLEEERDGSMLSPIDALGNSELAQVAATMKTLWGKE